jgi:hypothetical protein
VSEIVTLPTHSLVEREDRAELTRLVREYHC